MNPLLLEGLNDALAAGYGGSALGGIALAGLGGGAGQHVAHRWRASRKQK